MAEKKSWRDYSKNYTEDESTDNSTSSKKTGSWRDYSKSFSSDNGDTSNTSAIDWRNYADNDTASIVGENLTNRVNTWLENHNNYITNYQTRNSGRKYNYEDSYVSDSADWLNTISQQKSAFDTEADSILAQLDQYKGYFNNEWVESVRKTLTDARSAQDIILANSTKDNEWWSSFGNEELVNTFGSAEDAYKYYQRSDGYRQKYAGQKYDDIQKALSTLEDGEEKDWLTNNQYEFYKDDTNYNSKSRSGWKSFEAQKIAEWKEEESKTWFDKALESFAATPADTSLPNAGLINAQVAYTNDTTYREPNEKWSADQRNQFGYLWATDRDKAYEYAVQVNSQISDYEEYLAQQGAQQDATKNGWTMTGHTIGAIASAPLALGDLLGDLVEYSARGTITSDGMLSPFEYSQAVQSGIANKLNKVDDNGVAQSVLPDWVPIVGGKGWGDVYSLGVSAANSLVSAYTLGGVGTLVNFIGQGGASGVDEALSRGASPGQALLYGAIVGAAEGATEMLSADKLIKVGSASTLKNYLLKALGQGVGEFAEEGVSSVIGNIADNIIMQDKSNFYDTVEQIMDKNPGMSEEEAKTKAWLDMFGDIAFDALGGFVTGATNAMTVGGVNTAVDAWKGNQENIDAVKKYGGNTDALIQEGLQSDKNSESYQLADKYRQQVQGKNGKAGKAMTGFQIRNLLAANQEQVTKADLEKIQNAAANRLAQVGQREDIYKIAELATKYATGQEMTRAERSALARSSFGSQVASELLDGIHPDKLLSKWENDMSEESGAEYSTDWTGEIGTESDKFLRYNNEKLARAIFEHLANSVVEDPAAYKSLESRVEAEEPAQVSDTGKSVIHGTEQEVDLAKPTFKEITKKGAVLEADGKLVSANNIDYADADLGYAIRSVGKIENITPEAAGAVVSLVDMSKPVVAQMNAMDEAFSYGYNNYSVEDLKAGLFTKNLTDAQLNDAYKLGQYVRGKTVADADAPVVKMRTALDAKLTAEQKTAQQKARFKGDAEVYFMDGSNVVKFDESGVQLDESNERDQRILAGVNTAKFLSKLGIGGKYYFYQSYLKGNTRYYKDANGVEKPAPNGFYTAEDGSIHIDLNAGDEGEGTALFTLGHELTHFVKDQSKKQFKILGDLVKEAFDKTDMSMHKRVLEKQRFLESVRRDENGNKVAVSYEEAYEEVVADAMSTMLTDGSFHEKLMEIKVKDKGLFNTIKRFFEKMIAKFREVYAELTPDQRDARDIREMKDMFDKIQTAFAEALVEASDNFQAALEAEAVESLGENAKVETNAAGELLIAANERGNVQVYSERTYLEGGREKLEKALRQNGHTKEEIEKTLSYVDDALDYIKILAAGYAKNMGYTNLSNHLLADIVTNVKTGKQVMSAIVNNGDYPVNIDLSLICKKRVAYMNLMGRLIRDGVFDKVNYDGAAIAEVNEILRENGFETACLGCFVESRRLQFQTWAETIVSEWNSEVEKRNPNAGSFGFAKGKMENLTDADIDALTRELESVKKNDQGNVNLGQGNSVTRMGRLLDALPSLQKKLTVEDLLTPEGLTALRKHDGSLFSIVKSRYGAASPKIVQDFNPYASEIAMLTFAQVKGITNNAVKGAQAYVTEVKNEYGKLKKDKGESKAAFDQRKKDHEQKIQDEAMRRYLYDIGGARIQSFSDFMIENVFDYIQIFADLAAKRLPLHGYTKEIVCMRLFGMTGAKWNGSLIAHVERSMGKEYAGLLPAGTKDGIPVTVNGKDYVIGFDDYARNVATGGKSFVQSIGMKDIIALQLDPRYSPYVGNITIGVSDVQILAMLDNPLFRMVIPYHSSGMLPMFAKLVGVDLYNDYTDYQNTTVRQYYDLDGNAVSELKNAKGESVKADTSYAFNAEIQKTKDARKAADNYLNWCAQRHPVYDGSKLVGYATFNPKFSSSPYGTDFTRHKNYYKLLEDFNTYDCITEASTVQGAVTMNLPSEANRLTEQQMVEYKKALRETGIFTEKDIEKYAKKANMTFKDIIAAEVGNRANYAATQAPKWEATVKAVEAKLQKDYARDEKRSDRDYMAAVKRGDMETAQRMVDEAAKKAGYAVNGYHGTTNLFHVFDTSKSNIENDWGRGIYATTSEEDAQVNYASDDGADLTHRIERLAEMMESWDEYEDMDYEQRVEAARKQLSQGESKMLHVAIQMENPVNVERGNGGTVFTYESVYDEDLDEYSEPSGTLIDVIEAMKEVIYEDYEWASYDADSLDNIYEDAMDFGGISAIQLQSAVNDCLVDVYDEDGNIAANEIIRAAFERLGYDGIVDKSVPYKFGELSGKRFGGMRGVVAGTTHFIAFNSSQVKLTDPVTYDDSGNVIPLSERFNPDNKDIRYSERASNKELAQMDDTALYIKNTDKANYIGMIFNGAKTEETRSRRTLDAFIGKDFYVTDGKYVYGSIVLGEPHQYTEEEFHKKKNQLKHRVPVGDEYDIKPGGTKWAYPIESYKKFDKPKKLSDSKEYKNSFQARQVKFSDRNRNDIEKPTDNKYIKMVEDGATHIGEYDVVPKSKEPKRTILAWKALVVKPGAKNNPKDKGYGNMYPPQVHQVASTPYGVWLYANNAPMKLDKDGNPVLTKYGRPKVKEGMTYRPAWHFGDAPYASQFRSISHGFFDDNGVNRFYMSDSKGILVWALCEIGADENYQDEADMAGHVGEDRVWDEQQASLWYMPENGYYKYMTNRVDPNSVTWYLADKMRIVQTITDAEMREILTWIKEDGSTDLEFNYPLRLDGKDVDPADYGVPVGNVVGDGIDYVDRWKNQFREIALNGDIDITQSHFYYVPSSATSYGGYETVSFSKEVDDHSQELLKTKKDAMILTVNPGSTSALTKSFEASTGLKVREAKTVAGRKKIIEAAKNLGYDIVEFTRVGKTLGADVVIVNPDAVIRNYKFNNVSERHGRTDAVKYSDRIDTSWMDEDAKEIIRNLKLARMGSQYGYGVHKYASYTSSRMDRVLYGSMAKGVPDYAHGYIAWVDPEDFLRATTTSQEGYERIQTEAGELNHSALMDETQPIYLRIDSKTKEILGHEGRHRLSALSKAGYDRVAVVIYSSNRTSYADLLQPERFMKLKGQDFGDYSKGQDFYITNALPLSERYADAVKKLFSEVSGSVKFSERGGGTSNRSLLANAFEGISKSSIEYSMIQEYKGHIEELNKLDEKLSDINQKINKMLFDKETPRDSKKLKELQDEAKEVAKEINRYDKRLLNMEASEPLRKVIERERKKEAQKTKDHVKEIQKNKKDRAEQAEYRHKIRKTIRDLNKLLNRGNKKQNVKEDMKGFVSKALELADYLFTDHISNDELLRRGITVRMTPKEAALVKETEDILSQLYDNADSLTDEEFTRLDAKRKANEEKLRDLLKAQRNDRLNTPVYQLFNDLVTEYASLKNSKQDSVRAAYDEVLENSLRAFMGDEDRVKILKNMRVADMTTEELNWLYRAYTMVLTNVRNANKFHVKGMTATIEQMVGRIAGDFSSRKIPDKKLAIAAQKLANKIGWDYEKLYYALDRIGSEAFTELIMNIADSENTVMQDVMEAIAFRDEIVKNYGFNSWAVNKEIDREFMDNTGKKFKLTLGQLMALYAYSRREGAWDHIEYGGFVFGEAALTNPRPADSYKLSKEQCEAITSLLTEKQRGYAEAMQKYLSETMGEKGNEVSMMLYGIKMFGEKNYFPIHIAGQFKAQANESQAKAAAGFSSMSNAGFTHAQNPNAKAPFVLEGFNEIWTDHVNEMSRYHGTVPALEDLRRVMNRSTYSDSVAESQSIKQLMENSYGKEAVEYFDNLYREANSGAITDKLQKNSKKLLSLFRKNSVAYSLSVLIQQPASLVRAYSMIDKKYFGFKGFGAITSGVAKAVSSKWNPAYANAYNEMLKYAPGVTMAKEIGGFDTATGGSIRSYLLDTGKSLKQKWNTGTALEKGKAVLGVVDDNAIANLPNVADKIAWIEIWNACKREAVAKHKDLATNSEEFMQAVGERFTEVIRATQVYDSIFAKSPMLKSKNLAVQYLVSFMNEPNTVANMVEKAVRDATKGDWKSGAKTAAVVVHSIIFTNVLKSIVYAMRDEDEDETYIEKYIEAVAGNMMSDFNALNYIPIARDVVSLAQGYDVERADMAIVADALDALNRVIKNGFTETDDMTEEQLVEFDKKCTEANWKLVESVAAFFGIPVKNIRREIEGVINTAKNTAGNNGQTTLLSAWEKVYDAVIESIPFMQVKNTKQDKLYEAIMAGDQAYLSRLKSTYKDDSAYQSAVRKALRENDSRIHDAAQAKYEGRVEEYKRIFREIQKEGKFSFDDIMSAVNSEESAIRNKLEPDKATSSYTASDFVESIVLGDSKSAEAMKEDIIATKVANGKTQADAEKEFISSVATGIRDAYSSGLLDEAGAEKMLMEYADKDEEEAASKVGYWGFCEEHPQYDYFTESNVKDYREFAEPENISLEVYAQFINGTKGLADIKDKWGDVEVTKREQVLEVIDSLPLTWQQKDALYLAAGYSESKIWDVPW